MSGSELNAIKAVRELLWHNGFRPLPVYNPNHVDRERAGKAPLGNKWQEGARKDPPDCIAIGSVVTWATNTGILCDGLRAIDLDIDEQPLVALVSQLAVNMLGATIVRTRSNSPRCLLVYRAAEGQPVKLTLVGASHAKDNSCKIEVLGRGQQFVAYGGHPSGAELQWLEGGPTDQALSDLPAVSEDQVHAFLNACVPVIDAKPIVVKSPPKANGHDLDGPATAELQDVAAAMALIPNGSAPDWETWNSVGLAIYAATEGSFAGWKIWSEWSAKNPANDEDVTLQRWQHYALSPPDRTGAGKLFAMVAAVSPGWRQPSTLGLRHNQDPRPIEAPPATPPSPLPPTEDEAGGDDPPEIPPVGGDPGGPGDEPPLPVIECRAGELPRMIREAQDALLASGAPIYQRSMLVQPTEQQYTAADGSVTHSAALVPLTAPALLKLMAQSASYQKWDGRLNGGEGGWKEIDPPDKLVNIVLHNRGHWPFPVVRGVLTCPTLRPDGSLLTAPGYDPASRYYLMFPAGLKVPEIPDRLTQGDAMQAHAHLNGLLASYPFVNKASRSVAMAMLMTQVLRCAMPVAPLLAVSAKAPGTGKSHLVDLASTIAIGRPCPAMGTGKKDEEVEKGINTMLIAGVPGFSIDNVSRDLDTPILNMATERPLITIRLFGVLEAVEIENAVTVYMTGNNLAIIDEQGRRTIRCELDAGQENPERREFLLGDPILGARALRGQFIAAILTIARAYHLSGEKVAPFPIGSYGAWSHFVREPLIWLGMPDPCDTMAETAKDDPATARLVVVLNGWYDEFGSNPKTLADVVKDAGIAGFYPVLKEHFPARGGSEVDTSRMGYWLRKYVGRVVGGKRFLKEDGGTHHSIRWYVEKLH